MTQAVKALLPTNRGQRKVISMPNLRTKTTSEQVLQNHNKGYTFQSVAENQTSPDDTDERVKQSSPNEIPNDPFFHDIPRLGLETPNF